MNNVFKAALYGVVAGVITLVLLSLLATVMALPTLNIPLISVVIGVLVFLAMWIGGRGLTLPK